MSNNNTNTFTVGRLFYIIIALFTSVVGYKIHGSIFWAIVDWIFWPFVWLKWFICQEVNISIIKEAFSFFLK